MAGVWPALDERVTHGKATAQQATCVSSGSTMRGGYSRCQWLQEGMEVDICTDEAGALLHATTIHGIISLIDYAAGTFYIQKVRAPGKEIDCNRRAARCITEAGA